MIINHDDIFFSIINNKNLEVIDKLAKLDFRAKDNKSVSESTKNYSFVNDVEQIKQLIIIKCFTVYSINLKKHGVGQSHQEIGFFAISMAELPFPLEINGSNIPFPFPVLKLAAMAIDFKYQCEGIGALVLKYIEGLAQDVGKKLSCCAVSLIANQDNKGFFEKKGYVFFEDTQFKNTTSLRMIKKIFLNPNDN
jgi:GNAT superfamily N-acetyltransferase